MELGHHASFDKAASTSMQPLGFLDRLHAKPQHQSESEMGTRAVVADIDGGLERNILFNYAFFYLRGHAKGLLHSSAMSLWSISFCLRDTMPFIQGMVKLQEMKLKMEDQLIMLLMFLLCLESTPFHFLKALRMKWLQMLIKLWQRICADLTCRLNVYLHQMTTIFVLLLGFNQPQDGKPQVWELDPDQDFSHFTVYGNGQSMVDEDRSVCYTICCLKMPNQLKGRSRK